jgi:ABC-type transport system involved in multi-copper enzyme maturation permease subunit
MITAIRLESLKLRTTRMWLGLLGLATGLTVLVAVFESARSGSGGAVPSLAKAAGQRDILTATGFGALISMVFGTTVVTGEFRHKTITDTYLDEPQRGRVLAAKVIVAGVAGALFGLLATAITTSVAVGFTAAKGHHFAYSAATVARYGAGAVVGAALLAAVGAGLGALLRSQLVAAIVVFAWAFAVEQLIAALDKPLATYLPVIATSTMAGAVNSTTMPPVPAGITALPFGEVAALLAGLAIVLTAAAAVTTVPRDIT